jgi:hypothetical protein
MENRMISPEDLNIVLVDASMLHRPAAYRRV